jgi:hypothetical protein
VASLTEAVTAATQAPAGHDVAARSAVRKNTKSDTIE